MPTTKKVGTVKRTSLKFLILIESENDKKFERNLRKLQSYVQNFSNLISFFERKDDDYKNYDHQIRIETCKETSRKGLSHLFKYILGKFVVL